MSKRLLEKHGSANEIVDKWVGILKADGFAPDEILLVFRLAKKKVDFIIEKEKTDASNISRRTKKTRVGNC